MPRKLIDVISLPVRDLWIHDENCAGRPVRAVLVEDIEKAESVEVLRWIPVTERTPGPDEIVLAYCPCRKGTPREIQTMRGWAAMIHATHWMPLSDAPEVK